MLCDGKFPNGFLFKNSTGLLKDYLCDAFIVNCFYYDYYNVFSLNFIQPLLKKATHRSIVRRKWLYLFLVTLSTGRVFITLYMPTSNTTIVLFSYGPGVL